MKKQALESLPIAVIGGGPVGLAAAPAEFDACCVADLVAKDEGKKGCGCGVAA